MQYSPKLKKVADEIKAIFKKYDVAGFAVMHTPGFGEFVYNINPSYSCAYFETNGNLRVRATVAEYNGDVEIRNQKLLDTCNMLRVMAEVMGHNTMTIMNISDMVDKHLDADHGGAGFTSGTQQNN